MPTKLKYTIVPSVSDLKTRLSGDEFHDFVIRLAGGSLISSKEIRRVGKMFEVHNCIDGSMQMLTESQLESDKHNNIAMAMRCGQFYQIVK